MGCQQFVALIPYFCVLKVIVITLTFCFIQNCIGNSFTHLVEERDGENCLYLFVLGPDKAQVSRSIIAPRSLHFVKSCKS